ncbi:MAG: heavy-metal-associated domain-containing protein [Solirubrobacteraceae bacterium]|nr:heavy-metal-associated domain-containing protein [Solirubrobacteraceae bacterium]
MSQSNETVHRVEGMTCGHCEASVREEVEELDGVESAVADRAAGTVTVRGVASRDDVRRAVEAAGYALVD